MLANHLNFLTNEFVQFIKTHSALISYLNFPFTTKDRSLGYIYILRDPRDFVISWSKQININIQESINFLSTQSVTA